MNKALSEVYFQLLMRGVPRPLLAAAAALGLIVSALLLIIAAVAAFILIGLLTLNDAVLMVALAVAASVGMAALVVYQHLPSDPRKSKSKREE